MRKVIAVKAPWPVNEIKTVAMWVEHGHGFTPVRTLGTLCKRDTRVITEACKKLGIEIVSANHIHYKDGMVDVFHIPRMLRHLGVAMTESEITKAAELFWNRIAKSNRGRRPKNNNNNKEKEEEEDEDDDDEIESSVSSVGSPGTAYLPGRKRVVEEEEKDTTTKSKKISFVLPSAVGEPVVAVPVVAAPGGRGNDRDSHRDSYRDSHKTLVPRVPAPSDEPPVWAQTLALRIEKAAHLCVTMVGAQAVQAYCATDLFREDKKRAVEARIRELEPILRRELEPRVRADLEKELRAERAAAVSQNIKTREVQAMMDVIQQQRTLSIPLPAGQGNGQEQDAELIRAVISAERK